MGFSDEDKILIKKLAWFSLEFTVGFLQWNFKYNLWTDNVDFVPVCYIQCDLFDCGIFTKSCQQRWLIHSCSFYKVVH